MPRQIEITCKGGKLLATVDEDDFERVNKHQWCYDQGYVARNVPTATGRSVQRLHRFILNNPIGIVDHINGDGLDNRKDNLRIVDKSINALNRKCRGTTRLPSGRWRAQLRIRGVYFSQIFDNEQEASNWYNLIKMQHVNGSR